MVMASLCHLTYKRFNRNILLLDSEGNWQLYAHAEDIFAFTNKDVLEQRKIFI